MALAAVIQLVAAVILAIVGVWYTIETRLLRQQNAEQLELLRRQVRVQVAPVVIPELVAFDAERALRDPSLDEEQREQARAEGEELTALGCRYFCNMVNAADQLAYQVSVIVFEAAGKSYLMPPNGKEFLSPRQQAQIIIFAEAQTDWNSVQSSLSADYPDAIRFAFPILSPTDASYVAVLFRDGDDRLYMVKRTFIRHENVMLQHRFRLFWSESTAGDPASEGFVRASLGARDSVDER